MKDGLIKKQNYIEEVRNQYENYPYPPRDPQNEKKFFTYVPTVSLEFLNYYHYEGRQDFSNGYRVLIAGGGTGDAVVTLAEQCRDKNVKITYLDISKASMEVAKSRLKVRSIEDKVDWIHGSLLDCANIFDEKFDYINCSGVLHHLDSPEEGLKALSSVLKDDGLMAIMLYAKYGRQAVYQIQDLLKILNKNENNMKQKVENCKAIFNNLPQTNAYWSVNKLFPDLQEYGDIGIYDMFLHSNDVSYSVPEVYDFVKTCNLELNHFCYSNNSAHGNNLYNIELYVKDTHLLQSINELSLQEKQAAAELINSKITKHSFLASRKKTKVPTTANHDNVIFLSMIMPDNGYKNIYDTVKDTNVGQDIGIALYGKNISFRKTRNTDLILKYINGVRTIGEVIQLVKKEYGTKKQAPSTKELQEDIDCIFKAFLTYDWMFIRHKSVPLLENMAAIQKRIS